MIRVLLADDHEIVRDGLKRILAATPDVQVAAEAASGDEALELVGEVRASALELLPGSGRVFDLVYLPRFRRTIDTYIGRKT